MISIQCFTLARSQTQQKKRNFWWKVLTFPVGPVCTSLSAPAQQCVHPAALFSCTLTPSCRQVYRRPHHARGDDPQTGAVSQLHCTLLYCVGQATLHVGDEIREINGISVTNQSIESLQKLLREARGSVTFKVSPSGWAREKYHTDAGEKTPRPNSNKFVLRLSPPTGLPRPPATSSCGRSSSTTRWMTTSFLAPRPAFPSTRATYCRWGTLALHRNTPQYLCVQIISKDDHNWWQARKISAAGTAGLIPSPELQVRRFAFTN